MIPYSLLDLCPVPEGQPVAQALQNSLDLAQHAENWGYHRYWLAEHHNMPGIASSATAVLIGQIAAATKTMRVGSGGIMLPNHAPLMVAEQFGTLACLFPGRIDLGLGRAPGTDAATMQALRRHHNTGDRFIDDIAELQTYFSDEGRVGTIRAIPGQGTQVPLWMLGSSLFGAQLAAELGLPYAFASHFAPAALDMAVNTYRSYFKPSAQLAKPYFMLAVNVFAAESDAEGQYLQSSVQQAFANLGRGRPTALPAPVDDIETRLNPGILASVAEALSVSAVGSATSVEASLDQLIARYAPDEVILAGQIHDHKARLRSFEIAASVLKTMD